MKKMDKKKKDLVKTDTTLVKFLKLTKSGKYALIEKTSLPYSRIEEESNSINVCEEEYFYGLY